jgi:LemA protein
MKGRTKLWIALAVVVIVILAVYSGIKNTYNSLVALDEGVSEAQAQVQNVYQRRFDLIPNLVETVRGYASHERETLQAVIDARASATRPEINLGQALENPAVMQQFEEAQARLSGALGRLMLVVERYPDLKANQSFQTLMAQLEGSENRIAVERRRYNEVVRAFNTRVRSFPTNILAGMFGFERKATFEAAPEAQTAPRVDFGGGE